jgi:hypothetical protein
MLSLLCLLLSIPSCAQWQSQPVTPVQVGEPGWDHIRVTYAGQRLDLWNPVVSGDSLIGNRVRVPPGDPRWLVGIRLAEIEDLEIRIANEGKTGLLILGIVIAAALAAFIAMAASYKGIS